VGMPRLLSALHPRGGLTIRNRPRPEAARTPAAMVDHLAFGLVAWVAPEPCYLRGAGRLDQRPHMHDVRKVENRAVSPASRPEHLT
jgi:hypothetical protein